MRIKFKLKTYFEKHIKIRDNFNSMKIYGKYYTLVVFRSESIMFALKQSIVINIKYKSIHKFCEYLSQNIL